MHHAVIVLPTYNEKENIDLMLRAVELQREHVQGFELSILVVDDSSPDGTANVVEAYMMNHKNVHLITGKKEGLGKAYLRGFDYAIHVLKADVVFEMDADFSHKPEYIPQFLNKISEGNDFVIGSRYIPEGSIPSDWGFLRKMNSKFGNIFARYVAGLGNVKDCTSGYRAIKTNLIKKIDMENMNVKGYAFQMNLLHEALIQKAKVAEIPIEFIDRVRGESKINISDVQEFILNSLILRYKSIKNLLHIILSFLVIIAISYFLVHFHSLLRLNTYHSTFFIVTIISSVMLIQSIFTLYWMIYAWEDADDIEKNKSPKEFYDPHISFTALIPARNEEYVIGDTIRAVANIRYPEHKSEAFVICRSDDFRTIKSAERAIKDVGGKNIRIVLFDDLPINKPHALNVGLKKAKNDVVVIFDAEDEPHADIYNVINTIMIEKNSDVVQSGVQLVNIRSRWFSTFNVLEYFFWFKSALHLFAKIGLIPLGGNSTFFKRSWLKKMNGWDENCLTEDADIGIRLSRAGAKIDIVYDEEHATQEETPSSLKSFIKQRSRWDQGFLQVFMKKDWMQLSKVSQKLLALYILIWPEIQALSFLYIPISFLIAFKYKFPVWDTIITFLPLYLLLLQLAIYNIGLYEFTKDYKIKYSPILILKTIITFYPFQILLGVSALRALYRSLNRNSDWEKTLHVNAHRDSIWENLPQFILNDQSL